MWTVVGQCVLQPILKHRQAAKMEWSWHVVVTMNPTCDMHASHVICMQAMVLIDTWYVSANDLIVIVLREDTHYFCSFIVAKLLQNVQCMTAEPCSSHHTISNITLVTGVIFHRLTGSCKMIFPISYFIYSENYHVCLLITTRTNQSGEYNRQTTVARLAINNPPLWTINPCLYTVHGLSST